MKGGNPPSLFFRRSIMPKITKDPMDSVLANIEKQMGNKGERVLARFGDIENNISSDSISFGLKPIDDASYIGGIPRGKMVEIYGHESSGKSLLSLFLIASAQKKGLECALLDVEQSFDPIWATKHGVNVKKLIYSNSFDCGEQALEYAYQVIKSGAFALVIIDSTAALTPKAELEGTLEDNARVGAQAQLMSRGCRKIRSSCGTNGTTCVFINQVRMKIGVMYGNPETTPGGLALKFYSDLRIRVQGKGKITVKEGGKDIPVGQISEVTFVKNKTARPFGKAEFRIVFDQNSLNPVVMLFNAARDLKLIKTYKGIFNLDKEVTGEKIEMGASTAIEVADYLVKNDLVIPLLDKVIDELGNDPTSEPLDGAILEMKTDPTKITSPIDVNVKVGAEQVEDANIEELGEDAKETEVPN
jgi:recombination protein RecA